MGKDTGDNGSRRSAAAERARRALRRNSKTALVLGGGGFTGGVYEIGALRAFDLLAVNRTVNDFDIYVGTSAGSFVASMLANGVTPEEMMRVLNKALPSPIPDPKLRNLLRLNYSAFARRAALLPLRIVGVARQLAMNLGETSMVDIATGIAEGLPSGIYSNRGLEKYMAEVLSEGDRSDDFRKLGPELLITVTDVDTAERLVLGKDDWADVPISKAVGASTALPIVY
jgi:NTE family protein